MSKTRTEVLEFLGVEHANAVETLEHNELEGNPTAEVREIVEVFGEAIRLLTPEPGTVVLSVEQACKLSPFEKRAADNLADEVAVLVLRGVIDSRSLAGDALLDYRNPPCSDRARELHAKRGGGSAIQLASTFRETMERAESAAGWCPRCESSCAPWRGMCGGCGAEVMLYADTRRPYRVDDQPDFDLAEGTVWQSVSATDPALLGWWCRRGNWALPIAKPPPLKAVTAPAAPVSPDPTQPMSKPGLNHDVRFTYTNHRGETRERLVRPLNIFFGRCEYHPEAQWLVEAIDLERPRHSESLRTFALNKVKDWRPA